MKNGEDDKIKVLKYRILGIRRLGKVLGLLGRY